MIIPELKPILALLAIYIWIQALREVFVLIKWHCREKNWQEYLMVKLSLKEQVLAQHGVAQSELGGFQTFSEWWTQTFSVCQVVLLGFVPQSWGKRCRRGLRSAKASLSCSFCSILLTQDQLVFFTAWRCAPLTDPSPQNTTRLILIPDLKCLSWLQASFSRPFL